MNDALSELEFPRTAWRERARLIEPTFAVLKDAATSKARLNDPVLDHVEAGLGREGPEEDEIGPVDHVLAFALGEVAEFLVGVIDVVQEVDPVLRGLIDEIYELVGDDGDRGDLGHGVVGGEGGEGSLENLRGVFVRVAGQTAQEPLGGLNRVGDRDVFDVDEQITDFAKGERFAIAGIAYQHRVDVRVDGVTAVDEPNPAADRRGDEDVSAPDIKEFRHLGAFGQLDVVMKNAAHRSLARRKK